MGIDSYYLVGPTDMKVYVCNKHFLLLSPYLTHVLFGRVSGLRVADTSIFPAEIAGNTQGMPLCYYSSLYLSFRHSHCIYGGPKSLILYL